MGKNHNLLIIYLAALGMLRFPILFRGFLVRDNSTSPQIPIAQAEEKCTDKLP